MEVDLSEDEEENLRELEAMLYSRIHHEENPDFQLMPRDSAAMEEEFVLDGKAETGQPEEEEDSGMYSLSPCPTQNGDQDVIVLESSVVDLCDDSSEDSDDDGIQVLANPEPVPKKAWEPVQVVITLSENEEGSAGSNGSEVELEALSAPTQSEASSPEVIQSQVLTKAKLVIERQNEIKISKSETTKSRAVPKSRLVIEHQNAVRSVQNKQVIVPSDDDSSSSDTSYDSDTCLTNNLSLNLLNHPRKVKSSFYDILGGFGHADAAAPVPRSWDAGMVAYYNIVDHKLIDLSEEDIFKSIPRDACWKIDRADYYGGAGSPRSRSARYFQGRRCSNCNRVGHLQRDCGEPLKNACAMCGEVGHLRFRCPRQCCLRCGRPAEQFAPSCSGCRHLDNVDCLLCGLYGHTRGSCPDNWRRYHLTTSEGGGGGEVTQPAEDVHRRERDIWCGNCGKKGHHLHKCRAYRYSSYPYSMLPVVSYEISHDDVDFLSGDQRHSASKRQQRKAQRESSKRARRSFPPPDVASSSFDTPPAAKRPRYESFLRSAPASSAPSPVWSGDRGDDIAGSLLANMSAKDKFKLRRMEKKRRRREAREEEEAEKRGRRKRQLMKMGFRASAAAGGEQAVVVKKKMSKKLKKMQKQQDEAAAGNDGLRKKKKGAWS